MLKKTALSEDLSSFLPHTSQSAFSRFSGLLLEPDISDFLSEDIIKLNLANPNQVEKIATAIDMSCSKLAKESHPRGRAGKLLLKWWFKLQSGIQAISSTEYIIGWGSNRVLVQKSSKTNRRKNELTDICLNVKTHKKSLDFTKLSLKDRERLLKLIFAAGSGEHLEEFNYIYNVDKLSQWLASKLAILGNLSSKEIFRGDSEALMATIDNFHSEENKLLTEHDLDKLVLLDKLRRILYIKKEPPYAELTNDSLGILSTKNSRLVFVTDNTSKLDIAFAKLLAQASHMVDNVVLIVSDWSPSSSKSNIFMLAATVDGIFKSSCTITLSTDCNYNVERTLKTFRLADHKIDLNYIQPSWRVTLDDIKIISNKKLRDMRKSCFKITNGSGNQADQEVVNFILESVFERLLVYNTKKKIFYRQHMLGDMIQVGSHLGFDNTSEGICVSNFGHALCGVQNSLRLPLLRTEGHFLSEIRFVRESVRKEAMFKLKDVYSGKLLRKKIEHIFLKYSSDKNNMG